MSDIKFACPRCDQHIACDENYAGSPIECPACQHGIVVPANAPSAANGHLAAANAPVDPQPRDPEFWTEEAWNRHVAQLPGSRYQYGLPTALLVFLPIAVAWLGAPWVSRDWPFAWILWFAGTALCAAFAAWQVVQPTSESALARVLWGIPIGGGILIMQWTLGSVAGCCLSPGAA